MDKKFKVSFLTSSFLHSKKKKKNFIKVEVS